MKELTYDQFLDLPYQDRRTYNGIIIHNNGDKCYYVNCLPHRLDGPAMEFSDGVKRWYFMGHAAPVKSQEEFESWLKVRAFE